MKCSYCGNEVDNNFKFCPACGAKLEEDKVTSEGNISLIKAMVSAEAEKTETQPEQPAENKTVEVKPTENVVDSGLVLCLQNLVVLALQVLCLHYVQFLHRI